MAGAKGKGKDGKGKDGKGKGQDGKGKGKDGKGKGGDFSKGSEIFVGGLPFGVDEDELKNDFAECGEIVRFRRTRRALRRRWSSTRPTTAGGPSSLRKPARARAR